MSTVPPPSPSNSDSRVSLSLESNSSFSDATSDTASSILTASTITAAPIDPTRVAMPQNPEKIQIRLNRMLELADQIRLHTPLTATEAAEAIHPYFDHTYDHDTPLEWAKRRSEDLDKSSPIERFYHVRTGVTSFFKWAVTGGQSKGRSPGILLHELERDLIKVCGWILMSEEMDLTDEQRVALAAIRQRIVNFAADVAREEQKTQEFEQRYATRMAWLKEETSTTITDLREVAEPVIKEKLGHQSGPSTNYASLIREYVPAMDPTNPDFDNLKKFLERAETEIPGGYRTFYDFKNVLSTMKTALNGILTGNTVSPEEQSLRSVDNQYKTDPAFEKKEYILQCQRLAQGMRLIHIALRYLANVKAKNQLDHDGREGIVTITAKIKEKQLAIAQDEHTLRFTLMPSRRTIIETRIAEAQVQLTDLNERLVKLNGSEAQAKLMIYHDQMMAEFQELYIKHELEKFALDKKLSLGIQLSEGLKEQLPVFPTAADLKRECAKAKIGYSLDAGLALLKKKYKKAETIAEAINDCIQHLLLYVTHFPSEAVEIVSEILMFFERFNAPVSQLPGKNRIFSMLNAVQTRASIELIIPGLSPAEELSPEKIFEMYAILDMIRYARTATDVIPTLVSGLVNDMIQYFTGAAGVALTLTGGLMGLAKGVVTTTLTDFTRNLARNTNHFAIQRYMPLMGLFADGLPGFNGYLGTHTLLQTGPIIGEFLKTYSPDASAKTIITRSLRAGADFLKKRRHIIHVSAENAGTVGKTAHYVGAYVIPALAVIAGIMFTLVALGKIPSPGFTNDAAGWASSVFLLAPASFGFVAGMAEKKLAAVPLAKINAVAPEERLSKIGNGQEGKALIQKLKTISRDAVSRMITVGDEQYLKEEASFINKKKLKEEETRKIRGAKAEFRKQKEEEIYHQMLIATDQKLYKIFKNIRAIDGENAGVEMETLRQRILTELSQNISEDINRRAAEWQAQQDATH